MTTSTKKTEIKPNPNFKTGKEILENIVENIRKGLEEADASGWKKPWDDILKMRALPRNHVTQAMYKGINLFQLWDVSDELGYPIDEWGTFLQFKSKGIKLKKGAKSTYVIKYGTFEADKDKVTNPNLVKQHEARKQSGLEDKDTITLLYLKSFAVFNISQTEGYEELFFKTEMTSEEKETEAFKLANEIVENCGININHGFNKAYYSPAHDTISMPSIDQFTSLTHYYSTIFHEITHSVKASHRLDIKREGNTDKEKYALEELVAELGACILAAHCGISNVNIRDNHQKYIKGWISCLKDKPAAFQKAANDAFRRFEWVINEVEKNKAAKDENIHLTA